MSDMTSNTSGDIRPVHQVRLGVEEAEADPDAVCDPCESVRVVKSLKLPSAS